MSSRHSPKETNGERVSVPVTALKNRVVTLQMYLCTGWKGWRGTDGVRESEQRGGTKKERVGGRNIMESGNEKKTRKRGRSREKDDN